MKRIGGSKNSSRIQVAKSIAWRWNATGQESKRQPGGFANEREETIREKTTIIPILSC
jgi:hypothetical protein